MFEIIFIWPKLQDHLNQSPAVDDSDVCHEHLSEIMPVLETIRFWVEGVALSAIASFGLVGNLMSIGVICTLEKTRSPFNTILMALVTCDTFQLVFMIIDSAYISALKTREPEWYKVRKNK